MKEYQQLVLDFNQKNNGMSLSFNTSNGKYPFLAELTFYNEDKKQIGQISLKGKKEKAMLILAPDNYAPNEKFLPFYRDLISLYIEFAKTREGINEIFIQRKFFRTDQISFENYNFIFKDFDHLVISLNECKHLQGLGLINMLSEGIIIKDKDSNFGSASSFFNNINNVISIITSQTDKLETFDLQSKLDFNMEGFKFFFLGKNLKADFKTVDNDHFSLSIKELEIDEQLSYSNLENDINEFFKKIENNLKLNSFFSDSTYFLEKVIGDINSRSTRYLNKKKFIKAVKTNLLEKYSSIEIEKKFSYIYKNNKSMYCCALEYDDYVIFNFLDKFMVSNIKFMDLDICFVSDSKVEAIDFIQNKIVSNLNSKIEQTISDLNKIKK